VYLHKDNYKNYKKTKGLCYDSRTCSHNRIAEKIDNPLFVSEVHTEEATSSVPAATTNFTNSENTVISSHNSYQPLTPDLLSNAITSDEQSLKTFLMKPYRIRTGSLASTDTNATFANLILPTDITTLEPYASKLKGFLGMRADIVLRFQVNANKFQAGRYILAFCPTVGSTEQTLVNQTKFAHITCITQLPHVEIDVNTQTEAILRIPYVCISSHLPIVSATANFGVLGYARIFPYSPLVSTAGSTTASYDVYANFENISFAAPCVPQSGRFKANTTAEQKSADVGPIEGTMRRVAKAANLIGDKIPTLAALAYPVAWYSDIIAGVASVFGYSKPINLEHARRVQLHTLPYISNCDAVDSSLPLSLFSRNEVEVLPGFAGSELDETSFKYLLSKPAWYTYFTWTTAQASGTDLAAYSVAPQTFGSSFASNGQSVYVQTPVCFFSNFFRYYRGGFRFTFKVVKTQFHSGRIAITFNPAAPGAGPTTTSATTAAYVHREIIDIREGSSFDFIVPYVSLVPYRDVTETLGSLQVTVINPLIAPSTVSTTISFLVEVAAAPDFEFACPTQTFTMAPCAVYNPQASKFIPKPDVDSIVSGVIGGSELTTDNHISARACVGEKILSITSMLKKFTYRHGNAAGVSTIAFDPFALPIYYTQAVTNDTATGSDYVSIFSRCFALSRGSMRVKSIPDTTTTKSNYRTFMYLNPTGIYNGPVTGGAMLQSRNLQFALRNDDIGNNFEIQFPQYNQAHSRSVLSETYSNTVISKDVADPCCSNIVCGLMMNSAVANTYYYATGDDFQLGYFVGVPLFVIAADV